MTDEAYVQSLLRQYRDSLEAEPWEKDLTEELLAALKNESPEKHARLMREGDALIERAMRNIRNQGP